MPTKSIAPCSISFHSRAFSSVDRSGGAHFAFAPRRHQVRFIEQQIMRTRFARDIRLAILARLANDLHAWRMNSHARYAASIRFPARAKSPARWLRFPPASAEMPDNPSIFGRRGTRISADSCEVISWLSACTATGSPSFAAISIPRRSVTSSARRKSSIPLSHMNALNPTTPRSASSSR